MKIKQTKFEFVDGDFDTDIGELLCVAKRKYAEVHLCLCGRRNIPFARIKLHSSNLLSDAMETFDDAKALGDEICRRWNLCREEVE